MIDWYQVTPTNFFSANAMGHLVSSGSNCTGYVYGHNIILTARHCVRTPALGGMFAGFAFYRGRDGGSSLQNCGGSYEVFTTADPNHNPGTDFAAIRFHACTFPGTYGAGWHAVFGLPCSAPPGVWRSMWLNGYPGGYGGQQWEDFGAVQDLPCNWFSHGLDAVGGQSGGAMIIPCGAYGFSECALGHHVYSTGWVNPDDWGHRFTTAEAPILIAWRGY